MPIHPCKQREESSCILLELISVALLIDLREMHITHDFADGQLALTIPMVSSLQVDRRETQAAWMAVNQGKITSGNEQCVAVFLPVSCSTGQRCSEFILSQLFSS